MVFEVLGNRNASNIRPSVKGGGNWESGIGNRGYEGD